MTTTPIGPAAAALRFVSPAGVMVLCLLLTAFGQIGCSGSDKPPAAATLEVSISASPQVGPTPLEVSFRAVVDSGAASAFTWNFGDGSEPVDGESVSHIYEAPGTYTATLLALSGDSLAEAVISITVVAPDALVLTSVTATPDRGLAPLTVAFAAEFEGGTRPFSYSWDFGDISLSNEAEPTHVYDEVGEYTVTLTLTDGGGARQSEEVTVSVGVDLVLSA